MPVQDANRLAHFRGRQATSTGSVSNYTVSYL